MADVEIPAGQPLPDAPGIMAWLRPKCAPCRPPRPGVSCAVPAEMPAMAARRVSFAPSDLTLPEARAVARRAYGRARVAGGLAPVIVDRLWSETLMACDGAPAGAAVAMLVRTEHLMVLIEDRARWPR